LSRQRLGFNGRSYGSDFQLFTQSVDTREGFGRVRYGRFRGRLNPLRAITVKALVKGTAVVTQFLSTGGDRLSAFPERYLLVSESTLDRPCLFRDTIAQSLAVPARLRSIRAKTEILGTAWA
jgi:hypothetical protein